MFLGFLKHIFELDLAFFVSIQEYLRFEAGDWLFSKLSHIFAIAPLVIFFLVANFNTQKSKISFIFFFFLSLWVSKQIAGLIQIIFHLRLAPCFSSYIAEQFDLLASCSIKFPFSFVDENTTVLSALIFYNLRFLKNRVAIHQKLIILFIIPVYALIRTYSGAIFFLDGIFGIVVAWIIVSLFSKIQLYLNSIFNT